MGGAVSPAIPGDRAGRNPALADALFLAAAVALSCVLYLGRLGFYSDDWFLVASFGVPANLSISQQLASIDALPARPLQNLELVLLHRLFGTWPLGYHLMNTLVSALSVLLFFGSLRELKVPRIVAVSVPLLYALIPQYSTVRFWMNANAPNLSMLGFFLSLYAALRALRASSRAPAGWAAASLAGLFVSTLIYEAVLPLFIGSFVLIAWRGEIFRRSSFLRARGRIAAALVAVSALSLAAIVAYKLLSTDRPIVEQDHLRRAKFVLHSAFSISYLGPNGYGLGLPKTVWTALRDYPDLTRSVASVAFALGIFLYLRRLLRREPDLEIGAAVGFRLAIAGFAAFLLGIGMAFVTPEVGFSKAGVSNRTAIAAAPGVALSFIGGAIWLGSLVRRRRRIPIGVPIAISLFGAAGFLINNTLASFWIDAAGRQERILEGLKKRAPVLPAGSMVILDGECPYVGPGIVFEAHWDTGGALQVAYADPSLRGDVATRRLKIQDGGLETYIYTPPEIAKLQPPPRVALSHCCPWYPYGEKLFLYDARSGDLRNLPDAASARRHLGEGSGRNRPCVGREGLGAPVL